MMHAFGLTQMVTETTRYQTTPDLFLTSSNTLIADFLILPGVSDHLAVCGSADLKPRLLKTRPRKVFIYRRANWDLLKSKMTKITYYLITGVSLSRHFGMS